LAVLAGSIAPAARADETPARRAPTRQLLYPAKDKEVPESLRPFAGKLLAADQGPADAASARPAGVFVRVVSRKYILDGTALKKDGTLGGRPFIFAALPEALYGRSLLQVYSAIGYSADDVLSGELGVEKVVVLFRWEERVVLHPGRDGGLPEAWSSAVYPATWDNLFAIVEKMTADRDWHCVGAMDKSAVTTKLQLASTKETQFLLGYPDAGKARIKSSTYQGLREIKGADWEYRQLLERLMGAAEHYTGDGTSKPTILGQAKPSAGFPEFLGPNRQLKDLHDIVVIGLGALQLTEK
jgi:hypothetical protein